MPLARKDDSGSWLSKEGYFEASAEFIYNFFLGRRGAQTEGNVPECNLKVSLIFVLHCQRSTCNNVCSLNVLVFFIF